MAEQTAASAPLAASGPVQLSIRKGSPIAPMLLLLLTIFMFVFYALPSGVDQLGQSLGVTQISDEKLTFEKLVAIAEDGKKREAVLERIKTYTPWQYVSELGRPLLKIYVDELFSGFGKIARSFLTTVAVLAIYSLIPGLAGLIYRRKFLVWFLASFVILAGINATGLFGSLAGAEPMPGTGALLIFLLMQLFVLLLAYRLRRHSQGLNLLPPRIQNWGLTVILALVGVACWQGWGPGYAAAPPQPPAPVAASPSANVTPPLAAAAPAAPSANAHVPSGTAPAAPAAGATRSWIWGFLGSGLTGWIYKWEFILLGLPLIYTLLRNSAAWTAQAPKNIVVCLDGTSNTPDQMEMGFLAQTNVFKLFNMLKSDKPGMFAPTGQFDASLCKKYGSKQIALYYAGVGNKYDNDPLAQILGMATGMGAADVVERAYLDIVRVYRPGDRLFIFGFSRGAAISRLLARAIDARGAPRSVWTLRLFGKHRTLWTSSRKHAVPVDVLGCWDTVGAFGVAKTIAGINFQQLNAFKDLTIPDNVAQAYHMVALDEQRDSFVPTLMDPDPIRPERIVEVWFAGDHANIGGGWATDKLSDITLDFLLARVSSGYAHQGMSEPGDERWGLYLAAARSGPHAQAAARTGLPVTVVDPDPLGQVRQWHSNLYEYGARRLPLHAVISETVFDRMKTSIPVYAPQSLFDLNDALDAKRDHIAEKVERLGETNSLDEAERKAVLEYKDKLRLTRFPQYWENLSRERTPRAVELVLANAAPMPA